MTQLKILNWNVNQRSGLGEQIPDVVVNELKHLDADIVCLTEYVKGKNHFEFCEQLKSLGYSLFMYPEYIKKFQNEILIAIKTKFVTLPRITTFPEEEFPDFLHLQIDFEGAPLHIIGARIKIATIDNTLPYNRKLPLLVKDAKERLLQIEYITEYVRKLNGNILLMGDFNNFHYFEHQKIDSWEHDKEFLQNYYSYPLLVAKMSEVNLATYSPTGNYNEVYSWINPIIRADNIKRYIRNDHLFSNLTEISDIKYSWEFTKNPKYQNKVGFPDHAILSATISL
ncbi:endonuclease/exonuclease/phosphatase family protein [Streptococcus constellatus subsp. viborgensis]|uniref:endonuclease/exonuclease/phosphatase family protein n=1 Tax=Streptococcus constellatus TaxID=76860 RepID=UPI0018E1A0FA|nr:endonuclease/exonuclease/phosphatase family protein [Streptococcus constellatus]QQC22544.1 endonuclease/exonuclease/phosphatase family protein [Streptococcus constellatus]